MFEKILIANRGEIACRVIATARRLGVATVVVASEADRGALAASLADEVVGIGPAPASESYLSIEAIVRACRSTGAEAVHPGYGFLSENAAFAEALEDAGVAFIGPPSQAIRAMGDKITAKRIAEEAGVNVIPGHADVVADADQAVQVAREIGFPVMLKASAGGGGKGMRIARDEAACADGFERASSEARSSFGDARVFVEKFIEEPRHIEIQVLADQHGNTLHLGERECSIQRRHQNVLEEAPSPFIDEASRHAMGEQAVALARAVGYRSAGTVEFIVDAERRFYFLEMNTRLQVEHPVTEAVTGLDLVELMMRVAAGESLPFDQSQVRLDGWAMEARVYAEDPERGFLPAIGRLAQLRFPERRDVRVDTGVTEGDEVSVYYDPMIAKVIGQGSAREEARLALLGALDGVLIRGVANNVSFLARVLRHSRFTEGRLSTHFIEQEFPDGFDASEVSPEILVPLVAVAASVHARRERRAAEVSGRLPGHRARVDGDWVVWVDEEAHPVALFTDPEGERVRLGGAEIVVRAGWRPGQPIWHGYVDEVERYVQVELTGPGYRLTHGGSRVDMLVLTPRAAALRALMPVKRPADTSRYLVSPMPGLLLEVRVGAGDEIKAGQELAVVEAMKMENVLRAERDARVGAVLVSPGASVEVDQPIIEFE